MSTVSQSIPVERLWELYDYNPLTGQLHSKWTKRSLKGVERRGHKSVEIMYQGKKITTNYGRAVFAWCVGAWPVNQVDHINRDHKDNRFWNLRDVSNRENAQNRKAYNGGASKKRYGKYKSQISIGNENIYLGTFSSKAEAQAAYQTALNALS